MTVSGEKIEEHILHIDSIRKMKSIQLQTIKIAPNINALVSLTEAVNTTFSLKIEQEGELLWKKEYPICLLAFDQWTGGAIMPEFIAAFVVPNNPLLSRVLVNAGKKLEKLTGSSALDEYQTQDRNRVRHQVAAVYEALRSEGIVYCTPPARFEDYGQRIRLVDQVLTEDRICMPLIREESSLQYLERNLASAPEAFLSVFERIIQDALKSSESFLMTDEEAKSAWGVSSGELGPILEQAAPIGAIKLLPVALLGELGTLLEQPPPIEAIKFFPVAPCHELRLLLEKTCPGASRHLPPAAELAALLRELRLRPQKSSPVVAVELGPATPVGELGTHLEQLAPIVAIKLFPIARLGELGTRPKQPTPIFSAKPTPFASVGKLRLRREQARPIMPIQLAPIATVGKFGMILQ